MGKAMFLFIASLIFCNLLFLPLIRSWLLEKDRMLVEKRTIVYLCWLKRERLCSFRRCDMVPFLEIFITNSPAIMDAATIRLRAGSGGTVALVVLRREA
jgi:hypothetical protein